MGFATGQGGCRLTHAHVAEANFKQSFELSVDLRNCFEELDGFFDCHVKDIGNRLTFVLHFESFAVVPLALTQFARNVHVGQKVHFDFEDAVPSACLTASAFDIKAESSLLIASDFCVWGSRKEVTDHVEGAGVGCRV